MYADSSFGEENDDAVMSFSLPGLDTNRALSFDYIMLGMNGERLQVILSKLFVRFTEI